MAIIHISLRVEPKELFVHPGEAIDIECDQDFKVDFKGDTPDADDPDLKRKARPDNNGKHKVKIKRAKPLKPGSQEDRYEYEVSLTSTGQKIDPAIIIK